MANAAVREWEIGTCQLERGHFGGAEHRRGYRGEGAREAEGASGLDHGRQSDLERHPYRRRIERLLQRSADSHSAFVTVLIVAGAPRGRADLERQRSVIDERRGGEGRTTPASAERCEVHERLEG